MNVHKQFNTVNIYTECDLHPLSNIETMVNNITKYQVFSTFDFKSTYRQIRISDSHKPYTPLKQMVSYTNLHMCLLALQMVWLFFFKEVLMDLLRENTFSYLHNITVSGQNTRFKVGDWSLLDSVT